MLPRRSFVVAGALASLCAAALAGLAHTEGASCWVVAASADEVTRAPTPDFDIAGVRWRPSALQHDPALEPFRRDFLSHCAGRTGQDAALCITDRLAQAFPWGSPRSDFFAHRFDPAADLASHLAGEPGHCVPRSGITVDELLSVGIPARIAQLFPAAGAAHNVVEVWDARSGWTLVDPSYGGVLTSGGHPVSAAAALANPDPIVPSGSDVLGGGNDYYRDHSFHGGAVLYPEPWLYLRTGQRVAPPPFHGRFARYGGHMLRLGLGQWLLRLAVILFGVGAVLVVAIGLRGRGNAVDGLEPARVARSRASLGLVQRSSGGDDVGEGRQPRHATGAASDRDRDDATTPPAPKTAGGRRS